MAMTRPREGKLAFEVVQLDSHAKQCSFQQALNLAVILYVAAGATYSAEHGDVGCRIQAMSVVASIQNKDDAVKLINSEC
jgi:hypothetical protein